MARVSQAHAWRTAGVVPAYRFLVGAGYWLDWALALGLIVFNFTVPGELVPAVERLWFPNDPALMYPQAESFLDERQKFPLELGLPLAIVALCQLLRRDGSLVDWHHFALALFEAFAIECSFKKWANLVGKLRPDWYRRVATGDAAVIRDGRTSYPSGHAAETFMAFGLLSIYLMAKLRLFTHAATGHFAKAVACLLPVGLALFITLTRVAAYKHDFTDANAGIIIGLWSGLVAYFINYNSPFSADTVAQPRLRPLPPAPAWLARWAGCEAGGQQQACCEGEAGGELSPGGVEASLRQPLAASC